MSTTDELSQRARFLRNAAPQAYRDFTVSLANYTKRKFEELVITDGNFQLVQGHAQQCKKILQVLEEVENG